MSALRSFSVATPPLRIAVLVEPRYLAQPQPLGMSTALSAAGHEVALFDAPVHDLTRAADLEGYDLVVARGRSWSVLARLARAEAGGMPVINSRRSIAAVHNKAELAGVLADGRVATPPTFVGRPADLAAHVPAARYPLVLKPVFGDNSRGLALVRTPEELSGLPWPEDSALAQSYLPGDGYDLKLYGIGERIWAVRKPSPLGPPEAAGEAAAGVPLTSELEALGRRCGALFRLHLFGVDCILTRAGPVVIEVNEFPNYTGVPNADRALADYAIAYLRRSRRRAHRNIHA